MMAHSLANLLFFTFCFCATNQVSWPLVLLLFSFFSLLPCVLSSWLVSGGFAWRNTHPRAVRGPVGWPLFGSIPIMGPLAHRKLAETSASLDTKRLMALSLGSTRLIISSHPDTAKEILCGQAFSDRPIKEAARSLMFERAIGFAPSGEYWRHLRQIAAANMFSPKRIAGLEGLRQRVADEMLEGVWREMVGRGVVEVRPMLQKGSLRSVVGSVFGASMSLEGEELELMVEEGYDLIAKFNWGDYFPLGFLDFYGVRKRCHKLAAKVKGFVGQIIEERRREGECMGDDFLSVLLTLPEEERLSNSDMVAVLWVLSAAYLFTSLFLTIIHVKIVHSTHIPFYQLISK